MSRHPHSIAASPHRRPGFLHRRILGVSRSFVVVAVFAAAGYLLLQNSHAATYTAAGETESATITGNAAAVSRSDASGGSAVIFGAALPQIATNLVAYTGGDSIALRWDTAQDPVAVGRTVKQYDVYRDGVKVASLTPQSRPEFPEQKGRGYIDTNIVRGKAYSYQVRVIDSTDAASPLSDALSVTQPTDAPNVPNVTADSSGATDLAGYVTNTVLPFIKTWYPKMVTETVQGQYAAINTFAIRFATTATNGTAVSSTYAENNATPTLTINPTYARNNQNPTTWIYGIGIFPRLGGTNTTLNGPDWVRYGIVGWDATMMIRTGGTVAYPQAGQRYDQGDFAGAQFYDWVRNKYDKNIMGRMQAAFRANQYSDNLWSAYVGRSLAQLQSEWQSNAGSGPALVKFASYANKCLDNNLDGGKTDNRAQIWDCNSTAPQQWYAFYQPDGSFALKSASNCLTLQSPNANGKVIMFSCVGSVAAIWRQNANGSIVSTYSGQCIETPNGSTTAGTQLQMAACDGSDKQRFTPVPAQ